MVSDFRLIKKKLINFLDDEVLHLVQGTTDSEYCFVLFLQVLFNLKGIKSHEVQIDGKIADEEFSTAIMQEAMEQTIKQLNQWISESENANQKSSLMNFCVTDGRTVVATRYSNYKQPAASLFYSSGTEFKKVNKNMYIMEQSDRRQICHIISSEPLTDDPDDWVEVILINFWTSIAPF